MNSMTHVEQVEYRLKVMRELGRLKQFYTYQKITDMTGLPMSVLSRYVRGHVLPNQGRASYIERVMMNDARWEEVKEPSLDNIMDEIDVVVGLFHMAMQDIEDIKTKVLKFHQDRYGVR